jgi:hypothetical protein
MWPGDADHTDLLSQAKALVVDLNQVHGHLQHGSVEHSHHDDLALRCRSLGVLLDSALSATERDAYGPAFALIRSALEHVMIDKLAFLGERYVQVFTGVDDETWRTWLAAKESGEPWTSTIIDWTRTRKGQVRITREGLFSEPKEDGTRETISMHYFLLSEYSPLIGPPGVQADFDDGFTDVGTRREHAEQNRFMYEEYLKWSSVQGKSGGQRPSR